MKINFERVLKLEQIADGSARQRCINKKNTNSVDVV